MPENSIVYKNTIIIGGLLIIYIWQYSTLSQELVVIHLLKTCKLNALIQLCKLMAFTPAALKYSSLY